MIRIVVPMIPPSVNHYVVHTRAGQHFKTKEAESFAQAIALAAGEYRWKRYEAKQLSVFVVLGKGQKGDLDNFLKVPIDSLVRCGVIRSDATIERITITKQRGPAPRTEIEVELAPAS